MKYLLGTKELFLKFKSENKLSKILCRRRICCTFEF